MPASSQKVTEIFKGLENHYRPAHNHMRQVEKMRQQQYEGLIDVPYEVRIFRSSTTSNIISGYRNQIRTHEPTVNFAPYGLTKQALRHGTLMQRWGYSMMRREREYAEMDANIQCAVDLIERGAACKKILIDVDELMVIPPKKAGTNKMREWETRSIKNFPFLSCAIDPLSVFPIPGQIKPLGAIIEKQTRYVGEIKAKYPNWIDSKANTKDGKNLARPVVWLEYWTKDEYIVEADGEVVFEKENPYGFVPYIFEWAGMGRHHNDGDPKHLAVNIITDILGELEQEVLLKTAISVQTQMHVFPPILTVEDPRKVAKQFGVGPGKVIKHLPNFAPRYMEYPPPNENMYRFLEAIQQNIQRVAGAAIRGGREPGVGAGVLQAQLVGQELTNIATIRQTLDRIGSMTLNMMARMMDKFDVSMAVEGTTEPTEDTARVTGEDFKFFNFDVTFEAIDPAENDRMLLVGEALRRAGDISRHTFHKKYAKHIVEDPDFEEVLIYAERILENAIEQGIMLGVVMDEDVLQQLADESIEQAAATRDQVQNRASEAVPQRTRLETQENERLSGMPGASNVPREILQEGQRQSGV